MSLVDQRILIVAPVEAVWAYVAEPMHLTKWNRSAKQLSVLTTKATGVGARRRCVSENGRTVVEEMTAWFENIGYEYVVIDGPYKDFRGRFRLQAVPEGTIVNWTVDYHLRGVLPGVRNVLGSKRQIEDQMSESLRELRKLVENSGVRLDPAQHARFAMREAPSVEARASRAPSDTTPRPIPIKDAAAFRPVPVGEDDIPEIGGLEPVGTPTVRMAPPQLRPEPAISKGDTSPMAAVAKDSGKDSGKLSKTDTKPRPPQGLREAIAGMSANDSPPTVSYPTSDNSNALTVPVSLVAPHEPDTSLEDTATVPILPPARWPGTPGAMPEPPRVEPINIPEPDPSLEDTNPRIEPVTAPPNAAPETPGEKTDTGTMSIWDIFGMPKPSERAQADLNEVISGLQPSTPTEEPKTEPIIEAAPPAKLAEPPTEPLESIFEPVMPPTESLESIFEPVTPPTPTAPVVKLDAPTEPLATVAAASLEEPTTEPLEQTAASAATSAMPAVEAPVPSEATVTVTPAAPVVEEPPTITEPERTPDAAPVPELATEPPTEPVVNVVPPPQVTPPAPTVQPVAPTAPPPIPPRRTGSYPVTPRTTGTTSAVPSASRTTGSTSKVRQTTTQRAVAAKSRKTKVAVRTMITPSRPARQKTKVAARPSRKAK